MFGDYAFKITTTSPRGQWVKFDNSTRDLMHWDLNKIAEKMTFTKAFSQKKSVLYRKTSNISRILVGNKIVDNSDVVGASPVGAAPTTSSFST